jgi:hypothetical protein
VLEATPICWNSILHILIRIQNNIRKKNIQFLWRGRKEKDVIAWINCKDSPSPRNSRMGPEKHKNVMQGSAIEEDLEDFQGRMVMESNHENEIYRIFIL